MTTDPRDARYLDQADVRGELTRVFDVCQECRRCVDRCSSFPTLFELLDQLDEPDAGRLTPVQQDRVVGECFHCGLCVTECPYRPGLHDAGIDVPRSMLRATAMLHDSGLTPRRDRVAARVAARPDRLGALATSLPRVANGLVGAPPNSLRRRIVSSLTGLTARRQLPPYATQRFSQWFARRPAITITRPQGRAAVVPTCLVEHQAPGIGRDLVRVYERNGIECQLAPVGCCGAPLLHAGKIADFGRVARTNVAALVEAVRDGADIVVPQPSCRAVIAQAYADHAEDAAARSDAELVADHVHDASEYLLRLHRGADTSVDTHFDGDVPVSISYHAAAPVRAQEAGLPGRDLLKLTGADVRVVWHPSGIGGVWGLRASHDAVAQRLTHQLLDEIAAEAAAGDGVVAGDCVLANAAIADGTGRDAQHPLQLLARAYGIAPDT